MTECLGRVTQLLARSSDLFRKHAKMITKTQYVLEHGDRLREILGFVRAGLHGHGVSSGNTYSELTLVKASTSQKVHMLNAPSRLPTPLVEVSEHRRVNTKQRGSPVVT